MSIPASESIYEAFAAKLAERVGQLIVGPGLEGPTDQGPLIDDRALVKVRQHVEDALDHGARILAGGNTVDRAGHFFEPTVLADVRADALLCQEEIFGPVAGLVRFDAENEAVALANDTDAALAAYVFTRDVSRSWRVSEALEYGMVGLNTGLISTEVAPFGVKQSGFGREGSHIGLEDYLWTKLICLAVDLIPYPASLKRRNHILSITFRQDRTKDGDIVSHCTEQSARYLSRKC